VFTCEFGALFRKDAVFQIRTGAQKYGVSCEVVENKGFLVSEYSFRVSGDPERVAKFKDALASWCSEMGAEE
jgi:hypothetical protein